VAWLVTVAIVTVRDRIGRQSFVSVALRIPFTNQIGFCFRILIGGNPPGAHPRNLRATVVEAVEHVREQWSLEVVEYDHAGNQDQSNYASLFSVVSGFSISGSKPRMSCLGCVAP